MSTRSGRATGLEVSEQHNDGDGVWHEYARATLPAQTILIAAGTQPNTVLAREDARALPLDGKYFRLLDEDGQPAKPVQGLAKPRTPRGADRYPRRRPRDELLRRPASVVLRATSSRRWRARSRAIRSSRGCSRGSRRRLRASDAAILAAARRESCAHRRARRAADADDRRSRRARAGSGAALPAGAVLSAAEFRVARAHARRHAPRHGRPRADRRLGRSRAGARVDDRAGDGRLVRPVRAVAAGRAASC